MPKRNLVWKIVSGLGLVILVTGWVGAYTIADCGSANKPGLCAFSYTNDYVVDLIGAALIIVGLVFLLRKSSPEIQISPSFL